MASFLLPLEEASPGVGPDPTSLLTHMGVLNGDTL